MARIIVSDPQLLKHLPAVVVLVNSQAYGLHIRMKRGTHKKAVLNKSLQQNTNKTTIISQTAKGLYAALVNVCGTFRQKDLWRVILRRMFSASSTSRGDLLNSLNGLEINQTFSFKQIAKQPEIATTRNGKKLKIELQTLEHATFSDSRQAGCYFYGTTAIWLNKDCEKQSWETINTQWINFSDSLPAFELDFTPPSWAKYYLLMLRIEAGNNDEMCNDSGSRAMQVMATGLL